MEEQRSKNEGVIGVISSNKACYKKSVGMSPVNNFPKSYGAKN